MFNPVNNSVVNKERLNNHDLKEKNKKKRYEIRYDIEDHYRNKQVEGELKQEYNANKKISYNRYRNTDNRGYDIVNFDNNYNQYRKMINVKNKDIGDWENLISKAGGIYYI